MGDMTVRNIPDEIHDELRTRAAHNGRSTEAEVRSLITSAVISGTGGGFGDELRERFKDVVGDDLSELRSKTPSATEVGE